MNSYLVLKNQLFTHEQYSIVPIRFEDRFSIMKWRNEQIYHLRQIRSITFQEQDIYFNTVIANLFNKKFPNQILFSFLKNEECVGYGGLVHINWNDKNAEVSFLINTELENEYFSIFWLIFLDLLKKVAFDDLAFHKLFVYAYDLRPHLYKILESSGYLFEARLNEHILYNGIYKDVVIYSLINK
jgi:RimJ/RimL family protein N-acetyltransferase